jgi:zinc protease
MSKPASSQPATTTQAAKSAPPAPEKVTSVEGITEYRLANGLRVLIFPDPSKATITVNITYLVGSRMEGYGETGMAHLLEHMVFKGSTNHPHIPQELTSHGASPNGNTWYDRTNYFETFSATDENLNWALSLESDRMVNSFIADSALKSEFSVVRNEFESGENSPERVLQERVISTAYLWHNYGKSTIGSKEDIEKVPASRLKLFYQKYYQPDNAVLTIAGKVDEAKVMQLVNQYFGVIPRPERKLEEPYTVEPTQDGERYVELRRVGDVPLVSAGYHIPSGTSPDYVPVSILTDVLTNEPSGLLYKALVETKKASSVSGYTAGLKDPGYAYFSTEVPKEKSLAEARKTMMDLLDSIPAITQEQVDRAKNKQIKNIELLLNNSERLGLNLGEYSAKGDWRLFFINRDRVEKVTADDVNRVAKAYFKASNRTVGLFIPDAKPDRASIPASPDLGSLVNGYKGKQALANAETFDASPANIESRTKKGKIDGGAQYAFLAKSTRGGNVVATITLRIGSGKSLENKAAIADLTADMLNKGTQSKSRQDISDAFDKLKASVAINGSGQTVNIRITTIKENLNNALKLVTEILRQPAFPSAEFDKLKDENLAGLEQQRSEPQAIAANALSRHMSPYEKNDFRYVMTFDEQVDAYKKVQLNEVKDFYKNFYNSSAATLAIVGDFDETSALAGLNTMLASWQSPEKFERAKAINFNAPAKGEKLLTPDKKNANFFASEELKLKDNDAGYPALVIGNFMLGGGFLNSRLAVRIRQKEGLSYGVGSRLQASALDESGSFACYAIYNPDNADKLIDAWKDELNKMLSDGFTDAELTDAKSGYLQQQQVGRSKDDNLAAKLSANLYYGRTLTFDEGVEKKISNMPVADVNAAMKKFIHIDKISWVQAGDFKPAAGK